MEEMLMVKQLSKSYGERKVVDNLTFSVEKGTVLGLLGANGAGKSTSMECILGTEKRDSGEVRILGQDPVNIAEIYSETSGFNFKAPLIRGKYGWMNCVRKRSVSIKIPWIGESC